MQQTYLDYNATAPMKPAVKELMLDILGNPANASSIHAFGRNARGIIEKSREQIAALAGTNATAVTFTSGATETNNAVLQTFKGQRILVSAIEHSSIIQTAPDAEQIPVTKDGIIDMAALEKMLDSSNAPALISVTYVNSETGVIQPIEEIARLAKSKHKDIFVHCDAVQAAGRIKIDFPKLQLDYMSLSAHKIAGPQGAGALISAPGTIPARLIHGGGQEKSMRAGTENVAAIAGYGLAAELAEQDRGHYNELAKLRDNLETAIKQLEPAALIIGENAPRVANTSNIALPGIPANTQLMALDIDGIAVSSGSACSSGSVKPSHVLTAMGYSPEIASGALRISSGWATTEAEIDNCIAAWAKMHDRVKDKINSDFK